MKATMGSMIRLASLAAMVSIALPARAEHGVPSDVVRLKNGGIVRGTIVELIPGKSVEIVRATGETRTFPMQEVEYAGPADQVPAPSRGQPRKQVASFPAPSPAPARALTPAPSPAPEASALPPGSSSPTPAPDRGGDGKYYGALRLGAFVPTDSDMKDLNFGSGLDFEVAGGMAFTPTLAAEVAIGHFSTNGQYAWCNWYNYSCNYVYYDLDLGVTTIGASLRATLPLANGLTVTGLVGGGIYQASVKYSAEGDSGTKSDSPFGFHLGAGVAYPVSPQLKIGLEARYAIVKYHFEGLEDSIGGGGVRTFAAASYKF